MSRVFRRVVMIILDGVGVGALPDADQYGDRDANTLLHVARVAGRLHLPNLARLGLGQLLELPCLPTCPTVGAWGRMAEKAAGKDSTAGHWELMGVVLEQPLPTFPTGFPKEIIDEFTARTGLGVLGNIAASGTDIIRDLGEAHLRTGFPIIYTSVDSVFQIAAHEEIIPVEKLYEICLQTRELLNPWRVGRVIARPFIGKSPDQFKRTSRRHDYSLPPVSSSVLDRLCEAGIDVCGIGKIGDLYAGRGLSEQLPTCSNHEGMEQVLSALGRMDSGVILANLVDFDMLWGHRQDSAGFASGLEIFDAWLPELMRVLEDDDLLLVTADHGCDPTTPGTDHTREYVPLLAWYPEMEKGVDLGTRESFADAGATLAEAMGVKSPAGASFLSQLLEL